MTSRRHPHWTADSLVILYGKFLPKDIPGAEDKSMQYKVAFESLPWESPIAGLRQKVYRIGNRQLRLVEYSKNLPPHWCETGHMGYLLEGEMEIQFAHEVQRYRPGDGIVIPDGPEHKHSGRVLTETARVVFVEG